MASSHPAPGPPTVPGPVPGILTQPVARAHWLMELIAAWGFVQRNYYLTKRYLGWELVWLAYSTANVMSIGFIGAGVNEVGGGANTQALTTFLLVGALLWSYLSMLFDILSETVMWERWEGTIEYTFMSPASRTTHLLGTGIYAVVYGILRSVVMLGVIALFFDLDLSGANYLGAILVLAVASISLIGFGLVGSVMPLLSPEKGVQVTFIYASVLLLISGVYYPIDVLPGWMQALAVVSPVYYALEGIRATLIDGESIGSQWGNLWPLLVMGVVAIPAGIWIFQAGERFAKRTGRLKRSG
ncbi:MAG: Efflux ABC transporter, permease protein [uncultured Thermomicrobiales bacterium]|uniref:Transport permease protein n=1 Tax=uncultured Thermomicrobiales bacterium TaxID=1645740 RepID=A0A6J4U954_9BACT|nr:MAG: Efflux ABC transporter, permease protein [uncultured Thermomicrobiales bacterium]